MYHKLLFLSLLLSISSMSFAQRAVNVIEEEPQSKSKRLKKKSGKMTSTAKSEKLALSAEWHKDSIEQDLEEFESELRVAKGGEESEFNEVRVWKIKIDQKKKDLEKAKMIEDYKENRKDEVIENGPIYLKEIHDFVNGTVFERYGNLKTPEIEEKKDSTYFELMNYILDGKVIQSKVVIKPGSPDWQKRFDEENLEMHLLSMQSDMMKKGWKVWLKTNTDQAITEKEGFNVRNFDDSKRKEFLIECAIVKAVDKEGGFEMKDWKMVEKNKE